MKPKMKLTSEKQNMRLKRKKPKAAKGRVTRVFTKIEPAVEKVEEYERRRSSSKRLNATVREIQ